jgi:hypothetical protein
VEPREFAVNNKQPLHAPSADLLAFKMLLPHVLCRIGQLDPILASAIELGFQDATHQLERLMASSRNTASDDRYSQALATVRTLRATVGDELSGQRKKVLRKGRS